MKTLTTFRMLLPLDLKNIRRDAMLIWLPVIPLMMALGVRIIIPKLAALLRTQVGFELEPLYPLLMSSVLISMLSIAGLVTGFLLLDERDDGVFTALLVAPLPLGGYVLYRLSTPLVLGWLMTLVAAPLAGIAPVPFADLLVISGLGALSSPVVALFLATFASNKVAGLAQLKLVNIVMLLVGVAFFLPEPWQIVAGVVPAFWPMKAYWLAVEGHSYWPYVLGGLAAHALAIALLLRRFGVVVRR